MFREFRSTAGIPAIESVIAAGISVNVTLIFPPAQYEAAAGTYINDLQGTTAIDNARLAYVRFREIFVGERWDRLARAGARIQRPLWAGTGTKNCDWKTT